MHAAARPSAAVRLTTRPAARRSAVRVAASTSSSSSSSSSSSTSITTTSDVSLSKVEIKWGRTDTAAKSAVYEYDNLYRSGLPDEAVKVAYDGMQGALAYWIRQQQIVAEESLSAVIQQKLAEQRKMLAIEFEKDKQAALAAQKSELESKFAAEISALKSQLEKMKAELEAKFASEMAALKAKYEAEIGPLKAEIERLKALLAQAKADYDKLKGEFDGQIAALNAKFATREKELLDEIERLRQAVGLALKAANAKYEEAAKDLENALNLPIGQAVQRFKEIIDDLFEYQKQALTENAAMMARILGNK